jgi:quercetin dioxygenase-like cupin family protein/SAM-dependent methyltransferase
MFHTFIEKEMNNLGRRLTNCRMCNSADLYIFLDLGFLPSADGILNDEDMENPEVHFPLKVAQCKDCGLTQLTYAVNPELLYDDKYSYESNITETGKKHFFDMADSICNKFNLDENFVVDIGSNVGVLLEGFKNNGCNVLGIDAAPKIVKIANERGIETWQNLFGKEVAQKIVNEKGKAKVVCGTNVFAHIDDKEGFMESLELVLDDEGVFVMEAPYLINLIDNLEYDTIYLDHLEYLSLRPLVKFFERYGFEVFNVEKYDIHGSSIRVFVSRKRVKEIDSSVKDMLDFEEEKGIYKKEVLDKFSENVNKHRKEFVDLLYDLKRQGKKIAGVSAPAKGNTLLNYCKLDHYDIKFMTEKSKIKLDHYTPGMHIPIISEEKLLEEEIDYGIIFAWNFFDEIVNNEISKKFLKGGGKFIKPIPKITIMEMQNENLFGVSVKKIDPAFMDERGVIVDFVNTNLKHVGMITTEEKVVRGNHYHKKSNQYTYILSGSFEVLLAPSNQPANVKKVVVRAGEMISIPSGVIHQFKAIERSVMIEMDTESREGSGYEDDLFRVNIEYNQ